jgi:hypothetical protein
MTSRRIHASPAVFGEIEAQLRLTNDRAAARDFTMDVRLAWLGGHVGNVANSTECAHSLLRVAAVTVAWLEAMELPAVFIHTSIAEERQRQRRLFADKTMACPSAEPSLECWRRLRGLLKALGGVAAAVDGLETHPRSEIVRNRLMAELVEVAAVAIVWLEGASGAGTMTEGQSVRGRG